MKINKLLTIAATAMTASAPVIVLANCNPKNKSNITFDDKQKQQKEIKAGETVTYKIYLKSSKYSAEDIDVELTLSMPTNQNEIEDLDVTWTVDGNLLLVNVKHTSTSISEKAITFDIKITTADWKETIKKCSLKFPEEQNETLFNQNFATFRQTFLSNFDTYKTYTKFDVRTTGKYPDYWCERDTGAGNYYVTGEITVDESLKAYQYWPMDEMGFSFKPVTNELYLYTTVTDLKTQIQATLTKYSCTVKYFASAHQMAYKFYNSDGELVHITTYNDDGHLSEYYDIVEVGVTYTHNEYFHPSNFRKE